MGPESTPERCLEQAMACIQKAIVGINLKQSSPDSQDVVEEDLRFSGSTDVICKLAEITGTLERCMETQKRVNDLASGKMKCTTCGATSVGFDDCHNGASSTPTTQRSSEERRKVSDEEDEEIDEKCSSIGSQRVASVDSRTSEDGFEPIRSVSSSTSAPADEEETMVAEVTDDSDLVIRSILGAVKREEEQEMKQETKPELDPNFFSQFILENGLLGITPEDKSETPNAEENEEGQDQNNIINSFFQTFFQQANLLENVSTSNDSGTDSSQHSPPDTGLDNSSLAILESLIAENSAKTPDSKSSAAKKARKSLPMKVPKIENGTGYVCPMDGCNKIFKEKGSVHRHFVTHIGMRFNCDKCKASYTQKHALMLHQKIHANPDAYQCRGCGTNYTTQNGLRLHRQRNPTCMEVANAMDFKTAATPTKQMVSAP